MLYTPKLFMSDIKNSITALKTLYSIKYFR